MLLGTLYSHVCPEVCVSLNITQLTGATSFPGLVSQCLQNWIIPKKKEQKYRDVC